MEGFFILIYLIYLIMTEIYTKLLTKIQIFSTSKRSDEVLLRQLKGKIELVLIDLDLEKKMRKEVATVNLGLQDAKRLRAALDTHIKLFEPS